MPEMHGAEARTLDKLVFGEPREMPAASPDVKN
jgi:hypothetical protein